MERPRRHVLEHPQLTHDRVDDVVDPPEQHDGSGPRVVVDRRHDPAQVVEDELEPQLDRLVGDDEVQLLGVRRLAAQALQVEQLGDPQIAGVVDLGVVHGSIMAPDGAPRARARRGRGRPTVSRRLVACLAATDGSSHDLLPGEKGPQDACGVFGVWAPGEEVAKLTYFGLYALQHRGQESAGIAVSNGSQILVYKDMGLVAQVFDEGHLAALRGHLAIGHIRYSTTGSSVWENAQPTFRSTATGSIALGHNGNLTNTRELGRSCVEATLAEGRLRCELAAGAAASRPRCCARPPTPTSSPRCSPSYPDRSLEAAALEVLPQLRGAFSLVCMDETTLYAARDPQGIRPLVLGRLERGWVVASETAALDIVGASFVREIEPGELIAIDEHGLRTPAVRRGRAQGLPVRVRLPGPARHQDRRPLGPRDPGRGRPPARPRGARSRPTSSSRCPSRARRPRSATRQAQRHPVRPGPGEELLRRAHVHPAVADDPPARHPAQAQPAARGHRRQAAGRRRRLDRARQHPARAGPDAARGRRRRGARAHLLAAGEVAVLLRHRLRLAGRADRQRPRPSTRSAQSIGADSLAYISLERAGRGDRAARRTTCAGPASTASTRSSCPSRSCSASTCSRTSTRSTSRARQLVGGGGATEALSRP